ncbi:MAG TPA: hypothetical protein VK899_03840, partial [Gemmatimonadales bacterium]|nr:hypothetical protein [Gemmatimonadales bacterium]
YKLGAGLALFGQTKRAQIFFATALQLAEQHKLNAWYFKIEDAIRRLSEAAEKPEAALPSPVPGDAAQLREIENGLRMYASADALQ